jgi:nucleoside-diphosphate-sugar epimerase
VALALAERGDSVTCFQRSASGTELAEVRGDIRDGAALLAAAAGHDALIHLAALVAPRAAWSDAYGVNVTGTVNAQRAGELCGRFVHISSPSVAFKNVPAVGVGAEPACYAGRDVYTRSKAIAEQLVLIDNDVPTIVARAKQHRLAVPGHGRALIDTTYVDDAARAIIAALDHAVPGDEACGKAWVVTGADPRPVADLMNGILLAAGLRASVRSVPAPVAAFAGRLAQSFWPGSEPPITHFAARQLSVAHWFDQRETQRVLDWTPRVSVDEGLARLAAWFRAPR